MGLNEQDPKFHFQQRSKIINQNNTQSWPEIAISKAPFYQAFVHVFEHELHLHGQCKKSIICGSQKHKITSRRMEAGFVSAGAPFWHSTLISIAQARTMPEARKSQFRRCRFAGLAVRFRIWTAFCEAAARNIEVRNVSLRDTIGHVLEIMAGAVFYWQAKKLAGVCHAKDCILRGRLTVNRRRRCYAWRSKSSIPEMGGTLGTTT